jgi:hypothetical protein
MPGLQLDSAGPEDADATPEVNPSLYLVSSLLELVRMPMTRLSVTWSPA